MNIIIMIPARLGSQRLKQKNLESIQGKSILQIAAEKAKSIGGISEVWVNTESDLLGEVARNVGVGYHKRPSELANNQATSEDFVYEFLNKHQCDYVVQLHSICPLITTSEIQGFVDYLSDKQPDILLSCEEIQLECVFKTDPVNFSFSEKTNSQDLVPLKRIGWSISAWQRKNYIEAYESGKCATYSHPVDYYPLSKMSAHVIKTKEDLAIARALFGIYN